MTGAVLAWLPAVCLRDVVYPPAAVHTVYYDTPGLALLGEKVDSDYLKAKVRVRWYADLKGTPGGAVFAELKGRIGNRRVKTRVALPIDGAAAASRPLHDRAWVDWLRPLAESSGYLPASLAPVLSLRYVRHRFVDPRTSSRLTVDEAIAVDRVNPQRLHGRSTGRLPRGGRRIQGPPRRPAQSPRGAAALRGAPFGLLQGPRVLAARDAHRPLTMPPQLKDLLAGNGNAAMQQIGLLPFVFVMLVSLVGSLLASLLYLRFYSSRATGSQVHRAFPLLGLSITAIFVCIQFSLPLSLGLLGALSIVRFRTPIKEPEEIGFIMLVIATSIATATFKLAFVGIIFAIAILALLIQTRGRRLRHAAFRRHARRYGAAQPAQRGRG